MWAPYRKGHVAANLRGYFSKWVAAILGTSKTPITGTGLLNYRGLPFYAAQQMGLIRFLPDRGAQCCGKPETHGSQLYFGQTVVNLRGRKRDIRKATASARASPKMAVMGCHVVTRRKFYHCQDGFKLPWIHCVGATIPMEHTKTRCVA